jgi:hypothetical protein
MTKNEVSSVIDRISVRYGFPAQLSEPLIDIRIRVTAAARSTTHISAMQLSCPPLESCYALQTKS